MSLEDRFWSKVDKSGECWIWAAYRNHHGYGVISLDGKSSGTWLAHRVSWFIHNGPIPVGKLILHKCNNPACVRIEHLYVGTSANNAWDMIRSGRKFQPTGELNGRAKLTPKQIIEIRTKYASHLMTRAELAKEYNVNWTTIDKIVYREFWASVPES